MMKKRNNISINRKIGINIQKNISKCHIASKIKHNLQGNKKYKNEFKENVEYTKLNNNMKSYMYGKNELNRSSKNNVLQEEILNEDNIDCKYFINETAKKGNIEKERENHKMHKVDNAFDYKKYYERVKQWTEKRCVYNDYENKIKKKDIELENKKNNSGNILKVNELKKNTKRKYDKYEDFSNKHKNKNEMKNNLKEILLKKKNTEYLKKKKNINNYLKHHHNKENKENSYKKSDANIVHISNNDNYQYNNIGNINNKICNNNSNETILHNNALSLKLCNNKIKITNKKNTTNRYHIDKIKSSETILENAEKNIYSNKTIIDSFDNFDSFNNFSTNPTLFIKSNETIFHDPLKSNIINYEDRSNFNLFHKKYVKKGYTNYSTKIRTIPNLNILHPIQKDNNEKFQKNKEKSFSKGIIKNEYLDISSKMEILKYANKINMKNMEIKTKKETKKNESMEGCENPCISDKEKGLLKFSNDEEMKKEKKKLLKKVKTNIYNERNILKKNDLENNNKKKNYELSHTSDHYKISSILNIKNPFTCVYKNVKCFENIIVDKKKANKEKRYHTFNNITLCDKNIYISESNINKFSIVKINENKKKSIKNSRILQLEKGNIFSNENFSLNNNTPIEKNIYKNFNLDIENYKMNHKTFYHYKCDEGNFKNKKYFKKLNKFHKNKKEKNLIIPQNRYKIGEDKLHFDNNYRSSELDNELLNMNKHKKLLCIEEKDLQKNFDIFLCLFMKYEKNVSFLFCLIFDEELTKYSFFYQNHIKPILDDYKKSKFEKLKKVERNPTFRDYNCISLNKIIIEIMIPSIKNNYLKYINNLYNKKENNAYISSSDELQKEIREINKKIKNLEVKSLDKHVKESSTISFSNYEKKIKLIQKPKWSKEKNLKKLLRKQQNYNPFTIFGTSIKEVNLEEIFTLEVYNNYVTNEDRFQNKILYELYVGNYIKNLYQKIDYDEWYFVLDSLKKNWKYFASLECNMLLDPLLLEEILWYIDNNKMYIDKSRDIYIYETCFCPTPDPGKLTNLNDEKHFCKSMANKYTTHKEMKYKKLSFFEDTSYSSNFAFKYDETNREYASLYMKKKKEMLTEENLFFNIPRPSSAIYYDSDFFRNKIKKQVFRKKMKDNNNYNNNVSSPKCVEDSYFLNFKPKNWISQNFFDNFFSNYYLYNFNKSNRKYNSII